MNTDNDNKNNDTDNVNDKNNPPSHNNYHLSEEVHIAFRVLCNLSMSTAFGFSFLYITRCLRTCTRLILIIILIIVALLLLNILNILVPTAFGFSFLYITRQQPQLPSIPGTSSKGSVYSGTTSMTLPWKV